MIDIVVIVFIIIGHIIVAMFALYCAPLTVLLV